MTDEEAIEILKDLATFDYVIIERGDQAIETILNLIEKQQTEINALNQVHKYDVNMLEEVKGEAVKLYKIIDEMAGYLHIIRDCPNEDCGANIDCENRCSNDDDVIKACWIKYFKRKVEDKR